MEAQSKECSKSAEAKLQAGIQRAIFLLCILSGAMSDCLAKSPSSTEVAPQLIAQISAEEKLRERAKQEVAETTKQIKACPTNWKLYYRRASALTALVRYEEALEDSAKAIKLDPKQVDPLLLHARLCENTLDDETAAKDYTAAINLGTPLTSNYMLLRSHAYESMLKPDLA